MSAFRICRFLVFSLANCLFHGLTYALEYPHNPFIYKFILRNQILIKKLSAKYTDKNLHGIDLINSIRSILKSFKSNILALLQ